MAIDYRELRLVALGVASLAAGAGCAAKSQGVEREMVVSGTAQALADENASLRVAARWDCEHLHTDNPGVFIQIEDVGKGGGSDPGAFDLEVLAPPADTLDNSHDLDQDEHADYNYAFAQLVLLDDDELTNGWADPQRLSSRQVGQARYMILWVDRDMPETAKGLVDIGPVSAGFHLLQRQPDVPVHISDRLSAAIAVWKEVPRDTPIDIEVGSDGTAPSEDEP